MIEIDLSPGDLLLCGMVGLMRRTSALKNKMWRNPDRTDLFECDIVGAIAEYAVARAFGMNWQPIFGVSDKERGDLGEFQIKSITNPKYCLLVGQDDPVGFTYVLVLVGHRRATIIGKIDGHLAKDPKFWRERDLKAGIHQAAFFVPQSELEMF